MAAASRYALRREPRRSSPCARAPDRDAGDGPRPRTIPRVISHPPGSRRRSSSRPAGEQERSSRKYEPRLTAMVAKILQDKLPPIETWVGGRAHVAEAGGRGGPRRDRRRASRPSRSPSRGRRSTGACASRRCPTASTSSSRRMHGHRARLDGRGPGAAGDPQAGRGREPPGAPALRQGRGVRVGGRRAGGRQGAPRRPSRRTGASSDENSDELLDRLRDHRRPHPARGVRRGRPGARPRGQRGARSSRASRRRSSWRTSRSWRASSRRTGSPGKLADGREIIAIPIVVWAKGHVSVQTARSWRWTSVE